MKQELLEYLIRRCIKEVLSQKPNFVKEQDEKTPPKDDAEDGDATKGAAAPPGDVPEIPKQKKSPEETPSQPETPSAPPSIDLKGVVFVNPRDKAKLQKIKVSGMDDATLERNLHRLASTMAGSKVKIAISTIRMVKDAVKNPNTSTYIYLGKYDPNSEEVFLMADKSLQVAKDSSIPAAEATGGTIAPLAQNTFDPGAATSPEFSGYGKQQGKTPVYGLNEAFENKVRKMVTKILNG